MKNNNIEIGSVVFILNPAPPQLVPCVIEEQVITKRSDGVSRKHVGRLSNSKNITLESIEKNWFCSLEEAREYLTSEANKLIDSVIESGGKKAEEAFGAQDDHKAQEELTDSNGPESKKSTVKSSRRSRKKTAEKITDKIQVDLDGGIVANVTLPEALK